MWPPAALQRLRLPQLLSSEGCAAYLPHGEVKDTRPAFTPEDFLANIVTPADVTRKGRFPVHFMGEEAHPRSCAHKKQC